MIARLRIQQSFLRNPRFRSPAAEASFDAKPVAVDGNAAAGLPFSAEPSSVLFDDYKTDGSIYEATVVITNVTAVGRRLRLLPPANPQFSAPPPAFRGETGLLAPGMSGV